MISRRQSPHEMVQSPFTTEESTPSTIQDLQVNALSNLKTNCHNPESFQPSNATLNIKDNRISVKTVPRYIRLLAPWRNNPYSR